MTQARLIVYVDGQPIVTDFNVTDEKDAVSINITPEGAQIHTPGREPVVKVTPKVGDTVYIDEGDSILDREDTGTVTEISYTEAGATVVTLNNNTYNLDEVAHWEVL